MISMTRRGFAGLVLSALIASGCASVERSTSTEPASYIDVSTFEIQRILPPPPANDSARTRAELDEMLRIQQARTEEAAERARLDAKVTIFRFADAVDPERFTPERLPLTDAFFRKILRDEGRVIVPAKDAFGRPRPFVLEPALRPVVERPASASYPSGHSTWAFVAGLVLADMLPEKRAEIMARAHEYAHNRVVAGVHYPSDVHSGEMAGAAFAAMLFASPGFRRDEAAASAELRAALGLPPLDR